MNDIEEVATERRLGERSYVEATLMPTSGESIQRELQLGERGPVRPAGDSHAEIRSDSEAWSVPTQPKWIVVFKWCGVVISSLLLLGLFFGLTVSLLTQGWSLSAVLVVPAALIGYLAADLLSGTAHWFCDTFFEEDTPVIGPLLIQPFRDHHVHPQRITRYRFIEQDTSNFFLMLPLLGLAVVQGVPQVGEWVRLVLWSFLFGLALGSFLTNLFHKWAHQPNPPQGVRWLQRTGLILSPQRHGAHHSDYHRGFCVTSGWMNPLLDSVQFFSRIESAVRKLRR